MTTTTAVTEADFRAAMKRAKASNTHIHGTLLEGLKFAKRMAFGRKTAAATQQRRAALTVACGALLVLRDLVWLGQLDTEAPDVGELLELAREALLADLQPGEDRIPEGALVLDWLGAERLGRIVRSYDAIDKLEAADDAQAVADHAVAELRRAGHEEERHDRLA